MAVVGVLATLIAIALKASAVLAAIMGILGVVAVPVAVLAAQLVAAPYKQRNELRSSWPEDAAEKPLDVKLELAALIRSGNDLSRRIHMYGLTRNSTVIEDWTRAVEELLIEHYPEGAAQFLEAEKTREGSGFPLQARVNRLVAIEASYASRD